MVFVFLRKRNHNQGTKWLFAGYGGVSVSKHEPLESKNLSAEPM